jgi:hypothetical protein
MLQCVLRLDTPLSCMIRQDRGAIRRDGRVLAGRSWPPARGSLRADMVLPRPATTCRCPGKREGGPRHPQTARPDLRCARAPKPRAPLGPAGPSRAAHHGFCAGSPRVTPARSSAAGRAGAHHRAQCLVCTPGVGRRLRSGQADGPRAGGAVRSPGTRLSRERPRVLRTGSRNTSNPFSNGRIEVAYLGGAFSAGV